MAALVQAASACQDDRPILLFQEDRAGHGVGKPVAKRADELADGLTFLAWQLELDATGVSARAEWLVVGGSPEPWQRLGLTVVDGTVPLFGTGHPVRSRRRAGHRRLGAVGPPTRRAPTTTGHRHRRSARPTAVPPSTPVLVEHANGAIGLDHVVVTTNDLERTCAAIESATGSPLRRVREVGEIRQGFHRLGGGGLIVEVVERRGLPDGAGLVLGPGHQRRGPRRRGRAHRPGRHRRRHPRGATRPDDRHGPRRARPRRSRRLDDALTRSGDQGATPAMLRRDG